MGKQLAIVLVVWPLLLLWFASVVKYPYFWITAVLVLGVISFVVGVLWLIVLAGTGLL